MFLLVGCHSLTAAQAAKTCSYWSAATHFKGSHWSIFNLRRYSVTVEGAAAQAARNVPIGRLPLTERFSLIQLYAAQVLCNSAGAAAQAARNVPIGRPPLTYRVLFGQCCTAQVLCHSAGEAAQAAKNVSIGGAATHLQGSHWSMLICTGTVLCHSAGAAVQEARNVPIGRLPLTYSSTGSKKCSHWSAATHFQQHRQQKMFPLVGCHSLTAAQAARNVSICRLPLT
jgi:hypothetical protein